MSGVRLRCGRCGHEWVYTGRRRAGLYTTCPACLRKVRIPEAA
jgi:hypothetical protein